MPRFVAKTGRTTGWRQTGTWIASAEVPPDAISIVPYVGSKARQTFSFAFSDINGHDDIAKTEILIQKGRTRENACVVTLDRSSSTAMLLADKPSAPGRALRINSHDTAQNSQCDVSDLTLSIESPDSLRFTMTARFARKFAGVRNIFARVEDKSGERSAWRWLGIWLVPDE